jgi:fructokinase
MKKVLAFGELLWDVIDGTSHLGGAPLNFAVHYSQCGGESSILSKVGEDELGKKALAILPQMKVQSDLVQTTADKPTGTVTVTLNNGQPSYIIHEAVAYDDIDFTDHRICDQFDAFYFGTLVQRSSQSRESLIQLLTNCHFQEVFYDVNLRPGQYTKEIIKDSLGYCSILKLNDEEVHELGELLFDQKFSFDAFGSFLFDTYPRIHLVVITKGADGCTIYQRDQSPVNVPSEKVEVKDTVGAGDAFSASFTFSFLNGKSAAESAKIANTIAGFVASSQGAIPAYPKEIKNLLN